MTLLQIALLYTTVSPLFQNPESIIVSFYDHGHRGIPYPPLLLKRFATLFAMISGISEISHDTNL